MSDAYKAAYEREKIARLAAEKLLDEKSREVQSSIEMIQYQFNDLMSQKKESDYLLAVSRLTQTDQGLKKSVHDYTTESMKFLNAKCSRYSYISDGKIVISNLIGSDDQLPKLGLNVYQDIYKKDDRSTVMISELNSPELLGVSMVLGINRVVFFTD